MFGKIDKRFKVIHEEGSMSPFQIIQDTKTGVNYLFHALGSSGGFTPLLDAYGNVVITPINDEHN